MLKSVGQIVAAKKLRPGSSSDWTPYHNFVAAFEKTGNPCSPWLRSAHVHFSPIQCQAGS